MTLFSVNRTSFCKRVRAKKGFTLVEIALAVAIFAFAIVAIMALFPVGLRSASDSRNETIVAQIARTVLSDLRTGAFTEARVITGPLPTDGSAPNKVLKFDLTTKSTAYVLYTADGKPLSDSSAPKYTNGDSKGDFLVKIDAVPTVTTAPILSQVTVSVETPAAAGVANRTKYPVVTLMGDTR